MKACPGCARLFPDDAGFCPIDGNELVSATQAPIAAADGDPRVGQIMCGRYQIRRIVADGGMGRVYEALDMTDKRNAAMKILHPDVATDAVSLERFRREFEISSLLPHDHIVDVWDFQATHDGSYALVMEFLYGEELRATLKRENVLPPERVIRMVSQVAIGLDGAHVRKLVHRDLKPDNVFLCQTREGDIAKILDFGSVKDKSDPAKKLTVMGTTIGSPYYMAPEQAQGLETLDHRADVWALAAISYECLVGTVPFKGNNGPSILLEILTKEPPAPSIAAQGKPHPVPPTVDRVMLHAFKKNPSLRIPSVGAFADALGQAYGLEGTHRDWATLPQEHLAAAIAQRLPQLMQLVVAPVRDEADNFFGESESLGAAPGAAPTMPVGQVGHSAPYADDLVPMGVPRAGNFALIVAFAVGGVALLVGVLLVVVLTR